jgi:hypothetical protein
MTMTDRASRSESAWLETVHGIELHGDLYDPCDGSQNGS